MAQVIVPAPSPPPPSPDDDHGQPTPDDGQLPMVFIPILSAGLTALLLLLAFGALRVYRARYCVTPLRSAPMAGSVRTASSPFGVKGYHAGARPAPPPQTKLPKRMPAGQPARGW